MFAHSLELEMLVRDTCNGEKGICGLLPKMRERFDHYRKNFIMQPAFSPMGASQFSAEEIEQMRLAFANLLDEPALTIRFVSRAAVHRKSVGQDADPDVPNAEDLMRIAKRHALRDMAGTQPRGDWLDRTFDDRALKDIISSMIGTRDLQRVFDGGFGNSFANCFLKDAVALWNGYVCSILEGDKERACRFGRAIDICARITPIGLDPNAPTPQLLFFTH